MISWLGELEAMANSGLSVNLGIKNAKTPVRYQIDVSEPGAKRAWRGLHENPERAVSQIKQMMARMRGD